MKLSIITINYNNLAGLRRTLESVAAQRLENSDDLEWIVIDGGSTDGSAELIAGNTHLMVYHVSEPDGGIYEAMNKGIDHATGHYLQFLNSGDTLADPDVTADFLALAPEAALVYGDTIMVGADGTPCGEMTPPDALSLLYFYNNNLNHQAVYFSRGCLEGRRYDLRYRMCSDRHLILSLLLEGRSHSHWHRKAVRYDITGFSSRQSSRMTQESNRIMAELLPEAVARDYDTLVKLRDVPLLRQALDIVYSGKAVRVLGRLALAPVHLFARKGRHPLSLRK